MKKHISFLVIVLFLSVTFSIPVQASKHKDNPPNCKAAVLMEFNTGKIIFEYNPDLKLPPASVTKVMTMLLTMESVDSGKIKLSDKVTASARAKSMGGSTMYLETGEVRTVEELIKGVAIESANDAALALAEFIGGSEQGFVDKMNVRAKELGMVNTHFTNCSGLFPENHYTTAKDIAIMSRELLKHPQILKYTTIWMETITEGRKKEFTLVNRNKMLKSYSGCDGLKTGYIKEALYCISSTAKRGDVRFISVILGAPTWKERNEEAGKLLDIGFARYDSIKLVKNHELVQELKISKAKPEIVKVYAAHDLSAVVEKGTKPNIKKVFVMKKDIKLPLKKGDKVGIIKAVEGNKVYGQVDVVVDQEVCKVKLTDIMGKIFKKWFNFR